MDLDVLLKSEDISSNRRQILDFIKQLNESVNNDSIEKEIRIRKNNIVQFENDKINKYCKEGHLYLVEENINEQIFLWDLTDRPSYSFNEKIFPEELRDKAKEGAVFQYINGTYNYYSNDGFERI